MNAHIAAVDRDMPEDKEGTKGLLNPGQIYDYHQKVFGKYDLPSTAFGATPFTGSRWETYLTWPLWCWGRDR